MNGRKWVITAIILVAVLALVALILGAVLVSQLAQAWGGRESDLSLGDVYEPQQAV